jgi:hypothetical protein
MAEAAALFDLSHIRSQLMVVERTRNPAGEITPACMSIQAERGLAY